MHIYLQNEDDPDFLLREENFLCKSRFFSAYVTLAYIKKIQNCAKYYDRKDNLIPEAALTMYQSGIPDIYVIDIEPASMFWDIEPEFALGFLDLPEEKNNLIKFEDRVMPVSFLDVKLDDDSAGASMYTHYKYYLYVKVPKGVTEFSIKMYDQHLIACYSDDVEDVTKGSNYLGKIKVNLNEQ